MSRIRYGIAIACLSLITAPVAMAQQGGTPNGDSAAVRDLVRALVAQGKTSSDSELTALGPDWIYAGDPKAAVPFVERLQTFGGFLLKTKLPITGQPERPQKDIAELLEQFKGLCGLDGQEWLRKEIPEGLSTSDVPVMVRAFRVLVNEGKVGQFWCKAADGKPAFMVEVLPSPNSTVPLIPTSRDWSIGFRVASARSLEKFAGHEAEYLASVNSLRTSAKPGAQVQVRTPDLPDDLIGAWKRKFPNLVGNVCGLVTDVKPPLATVQLQGRPLAIEISQLLPQGSPKSLEEISLSERRTPQTWCVK